MVVTTAVSKLTAILTILSLLLIAAYPALAKDASTAATTRKEKIEEKIEARKEKITQKIEIIKEKAATREAALKAKLEKFRDKKKAEIASRVSTNLNKINQNQTDSMLKHLDKMSSLLIKLESRAGTNTSITEANASIASASAAVKAQAAKDYTISVTSESTVKRDAQKARDTLHTDLKTVRKLVISAKQAVANAIRSTRSEKESNGE